MEVEGTQGCLGGGRYTGMSEGGRYTGMPGGGSYTSMSGGGSYTGMSGREGVRYTGMSWRMEEVYHRHAMEVVPQACYGKW